MESLQYIDTLFKEYLLFRGFTGTLQAFNSELAADRGCGFQVDQISTMIFQKIIRQHRGRQLVDMLQFLDSQLYCHVDASYRSTIRKLEVSLIKYYLVHALKSGKQNDVRSFFADFGDMLMSGPDAKEWSVWFALPYVHSPASHPTFQVYFTKEWAQLVETSLRNFLSEVIQKLPLPAVLRFDTDRQLRVSLQRQCKQLQKEKAQLEKVLQQKIYDNPSTISASESGRFSLVDLIVDDDYTPSSSGLLSQTASMCSPRGRRHEAGYQNSTTPNGSNAYKPSQGPSSSGGDATEGRRSAVINEGQRQPGQNHRRDASFAEWTPDRRSAEPRPLISLEAQPDELPEVTSSSRASSKSNVDKFAAPRGPLDVNSTSAAPQSTPSDGPPERLSQRPSAASTPPAAYGLAERPCSSPGGAESQAAHRRLPSMEDSKDSIFMQAEELAGHEAAVVAAAFSPGGQNVATADREGVVHIWAPQSLAADAGRSAVLLTGAPVSALAWDARADKIMLVGTVGKGIKAWHADTRRMVAHMRLDPAFPDVRAVACSPADPSFACASAPPSSAGSAASGKLSVWNMRAFKKAHTFAVNGDPLLDSLAFSPDGRLLLAAGADGQLRLFTTADKSEVAAWTVSKAGAPASARFGGSEASVIALTPSGEVQWWDTAMLKEPVRTADASAYCGTRAPNMKHAVAASSDARSLVLTSMTSQVPVLTESAADGDWQFQAAASHRGHVTAVDWHPTMNVIVSGSADHSACLTHLDL